MSYTITKSSSPSNKIAETQNNLYNDLLSLHIFCDTIALFCLVTRTRLLYLIISTTESLQIEDLDYKSKISISKYQYFRKIINLRMFFLLKKELDFQGTGIIVIKMTFYFDYIIIEIKIKIKVKRILESSMSPRLTMKYIMSVWILHG